MNKPLINRAALRREMRKTFKEWGIERQNFPAKAVDVLERDLHRAIVVFVMGNVESVKRKNAGKKP